MNNLIRIVAVAISASLCAGGLILNARDDPAGHRLRANDFAVVGATGNFEFASSDLASFAQLEAIVRTDVASRFPNMRVELGSVKPGRGTVMMNVVLFGPNHQAQVFLYSLAPHRNSWKIVSTRRLWFVPQTEIARGLQV